jgi:hypothetical protein
MPGRRKSCIENRVAVKKYEEFCKGVSGGLIAIKGQGRRLRCSN